MIGQIHGSKWSVGYPRDKGQNVSGDQDRVNAIRPFRKCSKRWVVRETVVPDVDKVKHSAYLVDSRPGS